MRKVLITAVMLGLGALTANASELKALAAAKDAAAPGITKGYIEKPPEFWSYPPTFPVEWVSIEGGEFNMGTNTEGKNFENARPVHKVHVKTFQMSKAEVTVEQYAECVVQGKCTEPSKILEECNWRVPGRNFDPVNCITWEQADQYAKFKGARLPSEAEWEYAATSGGKNQKYPWGNDEAEPNDYRAVAFRHETLVTCRMHLGMTEQGLCDMAGNVMEWVQDEYQDSYANAPVDGTAVEGKGEAHVARGGSFHTHSGSWELRTDLRLGFITKGVHPDIGFRLARSR